MRVFYAGDVSDTGRFLYPATDSTFEIAAHSRSIPFDFTALARTIDGIRSISTAAALSAPDHLRDRNMALRACDPNTRALSQPHLRDSENVLMSFTADTVSVWPLLEQADGHFRVRCVANEKVINESPNDIMVEAIH